MKLFKVNFNEKMRKVLDGSKQQRMAECPLNKRHTFTDYPVLVEGDKSIERISHVFKMYDLGSVDDVTDKYVFIRTMAPRKYDEFSTIQIEENVKYDNFLVRIVATMLSDSIWQQMKYKSGGYFFNVFSM